VLAPEGFIVFSFGNIRQLQLAFPRLAWLEPQFFSLDLTGYGLDRMPRSTPIGEHLPYHAVTDIVPLPRGALVTGCMGKEDLELVRSDPQLELTLPEAIETLIRCREEE